MPAQGRGAFLPPPKNAPKAARLPATPMRSKNPVAAANATPVAPAPREFKTLPKSARTLGGGLPTGQLLQREAQRAKPKGPSVFDIAGAIGKAEVAGIARAVTHPLDVAKDVPKELKGEGALQVGAAVTGNAIHGATAAVLGTKGTAAAIGQELAKIPAEAINLPTQIPPTLYHTGKAVFNAKVNNNPKEFEQIETGLKEGSLGKLVRGKPKAAAEQFVKTPVQSGLEYPGAGALIDRIAGAGAKALKLDSAPISRAEGSPTSRPAKPLIGNATEPQRPYGKGYLQNLRQRAKDNNPVRPGEKLAETLRHKNLSTRMRLYVDRLEGRFHGAMRQTEAVAGKQRADAIRGPLSINGRVVPGPDAINLFGHGVLPDPAHWDHGVPTGLQDLAARYAEPRPHDVAPDMQRRLALETVERIANDTGFHRNPFPAYKVALRMAEDKRALEPAIQKLYGYTPEQMRAAKLTTPFHHWWAEHDPWVEPHPPLNEKGILHGENTRIAHELEEVRKTSLEDVREARTHHANGEITDQQLKSMIADHKQNVRLHKEAVAARKYSAPKDAAEHHESPFSISDGKGGRTHPSANQISKELEAKGVHESQLSFQSHRPFATVASDLHPSVGVQKGGVAPARGFRSGKAFAEGHVDLTHDAMARQYIADNMRLEREHQNTIVNRDLGLTTNHVADLLAEHLPKASPAERAAIQARIDRLRAGSTFFKPEVRTVHTPNGTETEIRTSAWQRAQAEAQRLKALNPQLDLVPYRVASPWAPGHRLDEIANIAGGGNVHDMLAPDTLVTPPGLSKFEEPHQYDRGEVGLMHKAARDRLALYEKRMGSNSRTVLGNLSTFWRKQNVAWSQKHIPGVTQELGLRAVAYKAMIGDAFRGYKALKEFSSAAQDPAVRRALPEVDHYLREVEHMAGAGVIQQSFDQTIHLNKARIENTTLGKLAGAFDAWRAHKVTGFPARMMADLGKGYMKATDGILHLEQKAIAKPFRTAMFGKVLNDESKALTGKKLPILKASNSVMKDFIAGQFNPKSIEHLADRLNEYSGDFQSASPATRNAQVVSPFFTWYKQALKFVYHTLPVHHPVKTSILAALEGATQAQREAEGQGYKPGLKLGENELQASQQGSVPSFMKKGNRWELQYYTPSGAVSKGVEGLGEMVFPYLEEPVQILKGRSAFTGRELPGHPEGLQRLLLAFGALAEGFAPVYRKAKLVSEGKAERAFLPIRDNAARNPKGEKIELGPVKKQPGELPGLPQVGSLPSLPSLPSPGGP